ncbi:MAG TPA: hypothetical protein VK786_06750 [bacterium]|nr:hypothetical protein [bacterium]
MVQGPNDLIPPTAPNAAANVEVQRHKQAPGVQPLQPEPFQQAADIVQLSPNAVQAAAIARAGGVVQQVQNPAVQQAPPQPAVRPVAPVAGLAAPTVAAAPTAAAPGTVFTEKVLPVQALASAGAATPAKTVFQGEPEVRPTRVQEALQNLAGNSGQGGAVNAQLAEKLLTEF